MSPWKVILATMVIFCCGVVTGSLVVSHGHIDFGRGHGPGGRPMGPLVNSTQRRNTNLLARMDKDLVLTADQHARIEAIMRASQDRSQLLWDTMTPALQKEMNRMHQEIQDVLTPEQQAKFTALMENRHKMEGPFEHGTNHWGRTNGFNTNSPPHFGPPDSAPSNNPL